MRAAASPVQRSARRETVSCGRTSTEDGILGSGVRVRVCARARVCARPGGRGPHPRLPLRPAGLTLVGVFGDEHGDGVKLVLSALLRALGPLKA